MSKLDPQSLETKKCLNHEYQAFFPRTLIDYLSSLNSSNWSSSSHPRAPHSHPLPHLHNPYAPQPQHSHPHSPRTNNPNNNSTPNPRTTPQTSPHQHRPFAAADTCPAAGDPAGSTWAAAAAGRSLVGIVLAVVGSPVAAGRSSRFARARLGCSTAACRRARGQRRSAREGAMGGMGAGRLGCPGVGLVGWKVGRGSWRGDVRMA